MRKRTIVLSLVATALGAATLTCSPLYVIRAGFEEGKILSRRKPIHRVIESPSTEPETRRKLGLVLQARDFAEQALALDAGESYTTYSWVDSDTLLLVLSAARRDRFQAYTWWFPIVGRVPYKGFFNFGEAYAAAERLRRRGFDTYVRPSGAFSTLGWFNDPLLNTVLRYGDVSLTSTVIHELLHNTVFLPGHVSFNESFANFVGDRGAILFFCSREGEESQPCRLATAAWADNLLFGAFLTDLVRELENLYNRTDISREQKIQQRERIFQDARARFRHDVEPKLQTSAFRGFADEQLDNATLIGTRLYYDRLQLFEDLFQRLGANLPATIDSIARTVDSSDDPFGALEQLLARPQQSEHRTK